MRLPGDKPASYEVTKEMVNSNGGHPYPVIKRIRFNWYFTSDEGEGYEQHEIGKDGCLYIHEATLIGGKPGSYVVLLRQEDGTTIDRTIFNPNFVDEIHHPDQDSVNPPKFMLP